MERYESSVDAGTLHAYSPRQPKCAKCGKHLPTSIYNPPDSSTSSAFQNAAVHPARPFRYRSSNGVCECRESIWYQCTYRRILSFLGLFKNGKQSRRTKRFRSRGPIKHFSPEIQFFSSDVDGPNVRRKSRPRDRLIIDKHDKERIYLLWTAEGGEGIVLESGPSKNCPKEENTCGSNKQIFTVPRPEHLKIDSEPKPFKNHDLDQDLCNETWGKSSDRLSLNKRYGEDSKISGESRIPQEETSLEDKLNQRPNELKEPTLCDQVHRKDEVDLETDLVKTSKSSFRNVKSKDPPIFSSIKQELCSSSTNDHAKKKDAVAGSICPTLKAKNAANVNDKSLADKWSSDYECREQRKAGLRYEVESESPAESSFNFDCLSETSSGPKACERSFSPETQAKRGNRGRSRHRRGSQPNQLTFEHLPLISPNLECSSWNKDHVDEFCTTKVFNVSHRDAEVAMTCCPVSCSPLVCRSSSLNSICPSSRPCSKKYDFIYPKSYCSPSPCSSSSFTKSKSGCGRTSLCLICDRIIVSDGCTYVKRICSRCRISCDKPPSCCPSRILCSPKASCCPPPPRRVSCCTPTRSPCCPRPTCCPSPPPRCPPRCPPSPCCPPPRCSPSPCCPPPPRCPPNPCCPPPPRCPPNPCCPPPPRCPPNPCCPPLPRCSPSLCCPSPPSCCPPRPKKFPCPPVSRSPCSPPSLRCPISCPPPRPCSSITKFDISPRCPSPPSCSPTSSYVIKMRNLGGSDMDTDSCFKTDPLSPRPCARGSMVRKYYVGPRKCPSSCAICIRPVRSTSGGGSGSKYHRSLCRNVSTPSRSRRCVSDAVKLERMVGSCLGGRLGRDPLCKRNLENIDAYNDCIVFERVEAKPFENSKEYDNKSRNSCKKPSIISCPDHESQASKCLITKSEATGSTVAQTSNGATVSKKKKKSNRKKKHRAKRGGGNSSNNGIDVSGECPLSSGRIYFSQFPSSRHSLNKHCYNSFKLIYENNDTVAAVSKRLFLSSAGLPEKVELDAAPQLVKPSESISFNNNSHGEDVDFLRRYLKVSSVPFSFSETTGPTEVSSDTEEMESTAIVELPSSTFQRAARIPQRELEKKMNMMDAWINSCTERTLDGGEEEFCSSVDQVPVTAPKKNVKKTKKIDPDKQLSQRLGLNHTGAKSQALKRSTKGPASCGSRQRTTVKAQRTPSAMNKATNSKQVLRRATASPGKVERRKFDILDARLTAAINEHVREKEIENARKRPRQVAKEIPSYLEERLLTETGREGFDAGYQDEYNEHIVTFDDLEDTSVDPQSYSLGFEEDDAIIGHEQVVWAGEETTEGDDGFSPGESSVDGTEYAFPNMTNNLSEDPDITSSCSVVVSQSERGQAGTVDQTSVQPMTLQNNARSFILDGQESSVDGDSAACLSLDAENVLADADCMVTKNMDNYRELNRSANKSEEEDLIKPEIQITVSERRSESKSEGINNSNTVQVELKKAEESGETLKSKEKYQKPVFDPSMILSDTCKGDFSEGRVHNSRMEPRQVVWQKLEANSGVEDIRQAKAMFMKSRGVPTTTKSMSSVSRGNRDRNPFTLLNACTSLSGVQQTSSCKLLPSSEMDTILVNYIRKYGTPV